MFPQAVLMRSGIKAVNTAKPKDAHNAVKRNIFNTIKASACWVWMPKNRIVDHVSKNISASVTLKRLDYIDAQGRFQTIEELTTADYRVTTVGSRLLLTGEKSYDTGSLLVVSTESNRRLTDQGVGSTSGIRACALRNFDLEVMELENTQNNALAKLPMLKLGEYEMWGIRTLIVDPTP
ncbi:hypothetical protein Tco_0597261 [Tanacetum coccineum]